MTTKLLVVAKNMGLSYICTYKQRTNAPVYAVTYTHAHAQRSETQRGYVCMIATNKQKIPKKQNKPI